VVKAGHKKEGDFRSKGIKTRLCGNRVSRIREQKRIGRKLEQKNKGYAISQLGRFIQAESGLSKGMGRVLVKNS